MVHGECVCESLFSLKQCVSAFFGVLPKGRWRHILHVGDNLCSLETVAAAMAVKMNNMRRWFRQSFTGEAIFTRRKFPQGSGSVSFTVEANLRRQRGRSELYVAVVATSAATAARPHR